MEIIIIVTIGIIAILNILGYLRMERRVCKKILGKTYDIGLLNYTAISRELKAEAKKTRKETQEIKTRLTQMTKDLNTIELLVKKGGKK